MGVKHLNKSKVDKADEYYTLYEDIEREMEFHKHHFKDKAVYCNCDNPYESSFFRYFVCNFNTLGLKRLTATHYVGSPTGGQRMLFKPTVANVKATVAAYMIEVNEVLDSVGDKVKIECLLENSQNKLTKLKGSGDFRSSECIKILKEYDIVVTNPPFSLFRNFVNVLLKHNKKFLILGGTQAISYSNIFPLLKSGKMNLGLSFRQGGLVFRLPDHYDSTIYGRFKGDDGNTYQAVTVRWYTNLEVGRYNDYIVPTKKYTPEKYPKFDNYDAIEVSRTADIPCDYDGIMGVSITSMGNFDPGNFVIIGCSSFDDSTHLITKRYGKVRQYDDSGMFTGYAQLDGNAVFKTTEKPDKSYCQLQEDNGYLLTRFHRVFIQRRKR